MSKNDGGPAFPVPEYKDDPPPDSGICGKLVYPVQPGMSLLDWLAGMAMSGILQSKITNEGSASLATTAKDAYKMAYTMLAEREKW